MSYTSTVKKESDPDEEYSKNMAATNLNLSNLIEAQKSALRIIEDLSSSNKILSQSNKELSGTKKVLAKTNGQLVNENSLLRSTLSMRDSTIVELRKEVYDLTTQALMQEFVGPQNTPLTNTQPAGTSMTAETTQGSQSTSADGLI